MEIKDIYTLEDHEAGSDIVITDPRTGKDTDFVITVMGVDSKAFRKANGAAMRKVLMQKDIDTDSETAEVLASITLGWKGLTDNGEEVEFSKDKAIALYTNAPYIADQVNVFIGNRKNFTKG